MSVLACFCGAEGSNTRSGRLATFVAAGAAGLLLCAMADSASAAPCNKPITVTQTGQMSYGNIAPALGGGTVTLSSAGIASAPAGFALTGGAAAGKFHVTGRRNCAVAISFVAGSLFGPGASMQVRNFTTDAGANPILSSAGTLDFDVGGDLVVNANQVGGSYSGSYTVTVIY